MRDHLKEYREKFREVIARMHDMEYDEYSIRQTFEQAMADYDASIDVSGECPCCGADIAPKDIDKPCWDCGASVNQCIFCIGTGERKGEICNHCGGSGKRED